ncbi:hypothetical protein [Verrucomicrobium spinosum]|uniref:hypothetical protein n=1 Tax=Verrucomicrobium spinosum TaxID=2736 RepID=UPI0001746333|nr:hypothetical protein [Verrucomicrobium spinosum]
MATILRKLASILVNKLVSGATFLAVCLVIGYFVSDRKDYPGKTEFQEPNSLISTGSDGVAHGNSIPAKRAAEKFASIIKTLHADRFTGGSGGSFLGGADFFTYCRHNPDSIAFIVQVPKLKSYKDAQTRETLAKLAWTAADQAAKELQFSTNSPSVIVGLRGFASYGPIWSGKRGGEPEVKTDEIDEVRRLYPFFVSPK